MNGLTYEGKSMQRGLIDIAEMENVAQQLGEQSGAG